MYFLQCYYYFYYVYLCYYFDCFGWCDGGSDGNDFFLVDVNIYQYVGYFYCFQVYCLFCVFNVDCVIGDKLVDYVKLVLVFVVQFDDQIVVYFY